MKCPLFRVAAVIQPGVFDENAFKCLKEECAWWNEESGRCAIFVGFTNLEFIKLRLEMIEAKMPHEKQFRK